MFMQALLVLLYVYTLVSSDVFLYISLAIIGVISISIIFHSSRRISQIDPESSPLVPQTQQRQPPQQDYHDAPDHNTTHLESETAPSENENETYDSQTHTTHTSPSIHNNTPPPDHPIQLPIIGSADDSLRGTGSVFGNDNHDSSSPRPAEPEDDSDSDSSSSSLDLSQ